MNSDDKIIFTPLERDPQRRNIAQPRQQMDYHYQNQRAYTKSVTKAKTEIASAPKSTHKGNAKLYRNAILIAAAAAIGVAIAYPGVNDFIIKKKAIAEETDRVVSVLENQGQDLDNINYDKIVINERDLFGAQNAGLDFDKLVKSVGYKDQTAFLKAKGMYQIFDNGTQILSQEVWENYEEARIVNEYKQKEALESKENTSGRKH